MAKKHWIENIIGLQNLLFLVSKNVPLNDIIDFSTDLVAADGGVVEAMNVIGGPQIRE